jgi:hypothetical protein
MVSDFAGKDAIRAMSGFDSRYMPDVMPAGDASARGNADSHRADLKRKSAKMLAPASRPERL